MPEPRDMLYIPGLRRLQRARRAVLHPDRPHTGPLMPSEVGRPMFLDRVVLDSPELVIVAGHIGYRFTRISG